MQMQLAAVLVVSTVLAAGCSSQGDAGVTTKPDGGTSTGGHAGTGGASSSGGVSSGGAGTSSGGASSGGASSGGASSGGASSGGASSGGGGASSGGASAGGDAGTSLDGGAALCALPAEVGPCDAAIPRFFFDHTSGRCKPFVYGGCGGNANNFQTAKACVAACAPAAAAPCDVVSCDPGRGCLYVNGADPVCAAPCQDGGTCPFGLTCGCGASCPYCKNCAQACLAQP